MAKIQISELSQAKTTLADNDVFAIDDSAASDATKKITAANLAAAVAGMIDADDIDDTSTTNKFVTATDLTNLSNLSGENTGDQDLSGLQADVISTRGDVIIGDADGAAARLAVGTVGQVLTSDGTDVAWADAAAGASPVTTEGDLVVGDSGGEEARLAVGDEDQVLTVVSGVPAWADASGGFENPMTTAGDMIIGGVDGAAARLAKGDDDQVLTLVSGAPAWAAAAAGGGGVGEFNGTENLTVTGTSALGIGKGTASGDYATAIGAYNTVASGTSAICISGGNASTVSGTSGVGVGTGISVTGVGGAAFGAGASVTSAANATALGQDSSVSSTAKGSVALGNRSNAVRVGEIAMAIEKASNPNRNMGMVGYLGQTTDATPTELLLNGVASSRLTLYDTDQVIGFSGKVIAADYTNNKSAMWTINGLIESHGGTVAMVGSASVTNDFYSVGMDSCVVAVTADDTNKALALTVTGLADTTIRWTARIDFVEDIDR